jgi:hypothetical protein
VGRDVRSRLPAPFDLICAVLRARLRGTQPPSCLASHFVGDPEADLVWAETASRHRITPALAGCIDDLGLSSAPPAEFRAYLQAIAAGNLRRNSNLRNQLHEVVQRLNSVAIVPCLLKGAARLIDDLYPDDSWRFMSDLDLLLPASRMSAARAILEELGYVVCDRFGDGKPHHHDPPLIHPKRVASIELHRSWGLPQHRPLMHDVRARMEVRDTPVGRVGLLAPEDQVVNLVLHLQVDDACWVQGTTRLRDLIELDLLVGRYGRAIDWAHLVGTVSDAGLRRPFLSAFCTASALLATPLPDILTADFGPAIRRATSRVIRQEHSSDMMRVGLAYGWAARHLQRLLRDSQHRRYLIRAWRSGRVRNSVAALRGRLARVPH